MNQVRGILAGRGRRGRQGGAGAARHGSRSRSSRFGSGFARRCRTSLLTILPIEGVEQLPRLGSHIPLGVLVDNRKQGEIGLVLVLELIQFHLGLAEQGIVGPGMIGKTKNHSSVIIHGLKSVGIEHGNLGHLVIDSAEIVQGFGGVGPSGTLLVGALKTILDRIPIGTILGLARVFEQLMKPSPPFFEFLGRIRAKGWRRSHDQEQQPSRQHAEQNTSRLQHRPYLERCQDAVKG